MEKIQSSLKNMVLVLVGVALLVGAVLAYVNHMTEGPIKKKAEETLAAGIKNVMGTDKLKVADPKNVTMNIDGKDATFVIHSVTDNSGKPLGAAVESTTTGFGGDLKVLVGFDPTGKSWVTPSLPLLRHQVLASRLPHGSRKTARAASLA